MRQLTDILRLKYAAGLSHAKIAAALGLSKGVVSKYVSLAKAKGVSWPLPEELDEGALERLLFPDTRARRRCAEPDYLEVHQELKRKGVTLQLLWAEYAAAHGGAALRYSQFCQRYRDWRTAQRRSMRQQHRAGEKLFIDYCGPTVPFIDTATGEVAEAQVFVAVWGASNYTYAEATRTQSLPDWIGSHQRALSYFGGCPALLVPDNLKSAVTTACRYEPKLNATYADMARHYGVAVLPARPYKPKDKAKAEVGVQIVERWILARLRHCTFHSLAEINAAIATLLIELNERRFQRLPYSRRELFERLDRPAMRSLPEQSYEYAEWAYVSPASITTSRSTSVCTRCRTVWSGSVSKRGSPPPAWRSCTKGDVSPCTRAAARLATARSLSTCPSRTAGIGSGRRRASSTGLTASGRPPSVSSSASSRTGRIPSTATVPASACSSSRGTTGTHGSRRRAAGRCTSARRATAASPRSSRPASMPPPTVRRPRRRRCRCMRTFAAPATTTDHPQGDPSPC